MSKAQILNSKTYFLAIRACAKKLITFLFTNCLLIIVLQLMGATLTCGRCYCPPGNYEPLFGNYHIYYRGKRQVGTKYTVYARSNVHAYLKVYNDKTPNSPHFLLPPHVRFDYIVHDLENKLVIMCNNKKEPLYILEHAHSVMGEAYKYNSEYATIVSDLTKVIG
jgi:hypothetical protein